MANARLTAARALMRVADGGYSNIVLDAELKKAGLDERDAAFASALFYGSLERRITIDRIISGLSSQPLEKLSPTVLEVLRLGIYQILYMDSVTDPAAVNESVELAKAMGQSRASGFVNGVMRSFIRAGKHIDFTGLSGAERLSAEYSAPVWLCEKWSREYGENTASVVLGASLGAPPIYIRVNTLKTDAEGLSQEMKAEGVAVEAVDGFPDALRIISGAPQETECYKRGLFHVQDVSSQLAVSALGAVSGSRVFDPCSAPGGKSFTAAELMGDRGEIVAGDLHRKRAGMVASGAKRLGITCLSTVCGDASVSRPELGEFDFAMCDVPCSGLGVIRRKPEIRFKKQEDMSALPELQYRIAMAAAESLKPGGVLLYSTCTLSRAENDDVADRLVKEGGMVPAHLPEAAASYSGNGFSATLFPGEFAGDGFFFARFIRK